MFALADFLDFRFDKLSGLGAGGFARTLIFVRLFDGFFVRHLVLSLFGRFEQPRERKTRRFDPLLEHHNGLRAGFGSSSWYPRIDEPVAGDECDQKSMTKAAQDRCGSPTPYNDKNCGTISPATIQTNPWLFADGNREGLPRLEAAVFKAVGRSFKMRRAAFRFQCEGLQREPPSWRYHLFLGVEKRLQ